MEGVFGELVVKMYEIADLKKKTFVLSQLKWIYSTAKIDPALYLLWSLQNFSLK